MRDLDDPAALSVRTHDVPLVLDQLPVEAAVRDALWRNGIDLAVTVPCKYIARLLVEMKQDPRFTLIYASREEEGLGIAAGAARAVAGP